MIKALCLALLLLVSVPVAADEWQEADRAFVEGRFAEALALTTPLAEAGLVAAQNRLAHIYRYGDGTAIDHHLSLHWSRQAAAQGSGHAMFVLHVFHREGLGVAKDEVAARHWLEQAAEHGEPLAYYNLYVDLTREKGGTQNDPLALSYLQKAVELGGSDGQLALAQVYFFGELGLERNYAQALKFAQMAAGQRNMAAFIFASALLAHTDLTDVVDYPLSALYLRAALREGCTGVGRQLWLLMQVMPIKDVLQSDRRLAQWLEDHPAPEPHRHRALPDACAVP